MKTITIASRCCSLSLLVSCLATGCIEDRSLGEPELSDDQDPQDPGTLVEADVITRVSIALDLEGSGDDELEQPVGLALADDASVAVVTMRAPSPDFDVSESIVRIYAPGSLLTAEIVLPSTRLRLFDRAAGDPWRGLAQPGDDRSACGPTQVVELAPGESSWSTRGTITFPDPTLEGCRLALAPHEGTVLAFGPESSDASTWALRTFDLDGNALTPAVPIALGGLVYDIAAMGGTLWLFESIDDGHARVRRFGADGSEVFAADWYHAPDRDFEYRWRPQGGIDLIRSESTDPLVHWLEGFEADGTPTPPVALPTGFSSPQPYTAPGGQRLVLESSDAVTVSELDEGGQVQATIPLWSDAIVDDAAISGSSMALLTNAFEGSGTRAELMVVAL